METKRVALKLRGKFCGCDPNNPSVVYADRDAARSWEQADMGKKSDGQFIITWLAANRGFCVDDRGALVTRTAGTSTAWETFRGAEIPPDWPPMLLAANGVCFDIVFL